MAMSPGSLNGGAGAAAAAGLLIDSSSSTTTTNTFQIAASSIMDSSRVSTCLISMLLIVYGSFRSLNIEQEARERELKKRNESTTNLLTGEPVQQETSKFLNDSHSNY